MDVSVAEAQKPLLLFSGGKDSLACYYLLREIWDKLLIVYVNTGDAFPETLETVSKVKASHPLFLEIQSDVKTFRKNCGNPFDVVPTDQTTLGSSHTGIPASAPMCRTLDCCGANLWTPVATLFDRLKPDVVIRGERKSESIKSPITPNYVENGISFVLPIYEWSDKDVLDYLESQGVDLPLHYFFEESSLDCMGCTAYVKHTKDRQEWMKKKYPEQFAANKEFQRKALDVVKLKVKEVEALL